MDQHGGQSIPNFDYGLAPGVAKTFIKVYKDNLKKALMLMLNYEENKAIGIVDICVPDYETNQYPPLDEELYFQDYKAYEYGTLFSYLDNKDKIDDIQRFAYKMAKQETIKKTYQAMEGFLHNLNTMHCLHETQEVYTLGKVLKPIKDINKNDYVLSLNENGELEYKKVVAKMNNGIRTVYKFTTQDSSYILCTDNHRVLQFEDNNMFYKEIGEVDYLISYDNDKLIKQKIVSKEIYDESNVIDIEVDDNHNFITKGNYVVHNSRAGAQVPFSSINFGTDTSAEGRLIIEQFLLSVEAGLGNGETAIFPISCFKVKEGINYNSTDPNYDLFKLAIRVSAKRLFPNFVFLDAPFNAQYYKPGQPETEAVAMGCRTRVLSSVFPESDGIVFGRGNNSFTSINLPRIGIKYGICLGERDTADIDGFYKELDEIIELVISQLLERYKIQANKKVKNFPFLMGQKVWFGSEELGWEDTLEKVIKHGTLTTGFIGLAETLIALVGKHHGEDQNAQKLGLEIISYMRDKMDKAAEKYTLNFSLIATPKHRWEAI